MGASGNGNHGTLADPRPDRHPAVRWTASLLLAGVGVALVAWAARADRPWWEEHMFVADCATGPVDMASIKITRGLAAVVGLAVLLLSPRMGRRLAGLRGEAAAAVARMGVAALLALIVCEVVLRLTTGPSEIPDDSPALQPDPHLAMVLTPHTSGHVMRGGRDLQFSVNALGLRAKDKDDLPDLSRPSILIAGESIALGYSVPYEESPGVLVEQATGMPTLTAAVTTYATDQVYRRMQQVLPRLEHPVAVVTFVVSVQIERNLSNRREHLLLEDDGSLAVVPPASKFVRDMQLLRLLLKEAPHDDTAVRTARAIYLATAKEVRARGAYPLFVATNYRSPCLHDESGESSLAHRLFEGLDLPYVSVDLDVSFDVPGDGHPDVRGSRALASAIAAALRKAGVVGGRLAQ